MVSAGILGGTGVVLGAFGAHMMKGYLQAAGVADVWETAVRYQLVHAVALVGIAGWMRGAGELGLRRAGWAVRLWTVGAVLFSGSLYLLAMGGPRWLGPVTPAGGAALIAGWVMAAASAAG
jgi:uncharacterized membrane protein YgdD (TMEM256/DUF423 family)